MTATDTDLLVARFEAVVARLEQLAGPEAGLQVYSIPPPHVAAGELIESAWGNSVVDTFAIQATHSSFNAGDTIQSGPLIQTRAQVLTTDPAGLVTCGFRYAFAATPGVVAVGAEPALAHLFTLQSVTTTGFVVQVRAADTGLAAASSTCAVSYIAIGPRG